MAGVERRLSAIEGAVGELRGEVGELRGEVGELRGEVGELRGEVGELRGEVGELRGEVGELRGEVGELRGEVHKLRVLAEHTAGEVKLLAEVQARHGERLDEHSAMLEELRRDVEPLKVLPGLVQQIIVQLGPLNDMRDLMARVVNDHERRITALEQRDATRTN